MLKIIQSLSVMKVTWLSAAAYQCLSQNQLWAKGRLEQQRGREENISYLTSSCNVNLVRMGLQIVFLSWKSHKCELLCFQTFWK